ncbi:RAMP superfamily CRISPR-associated protein [Thermocoleostomius sinensis]|jgi:CRISPR/Cas system CSM-associated protein Csm3 (group 7 of RAMP superfamily)|uniref:RAMP superfamily CRISPR-associated protein n=1 Tax=Thermocoleostomius sinensis A174 TaxID=2016057 RepID=A0A9E9C708_9CYAN|nr:RAMP superfamily CRISPR-associated protein [Thermocoleostomius sinensis]WAL59839.1 RAMP superfamily CRISPR-associated protein [Thermocoleostomius sinensis A174]
MIQLASLNQSFQPSTTLPLTAIIDTALCVGAGGSSGSLSDKPILKRADGKLIIPASQLKGRLRHECEKIARALGWAICESPVAETMCPQRAGLTGNFQHEHYEIGDRNPDGSPRHHCLICQLFGNPSLPARLQFSDLICTEDPDNTPEVLRPGVTINRRRRTAEEKKLYFLETSPANAQLPFTGEITLLPGTPYFAQALILAGLKHIHALGGSKSAGLGWLQWESSVFKHPEINDDIWEFLAAAPSPPSGGEP